MKFDLIDGIYSPHRTNPIKANLENIPDSVLPKGVSGNMTVSEVMSIVAGLLSVLGQSSGLIDAMIDQDKQLEKLIAGSTLDPIVKKQIIKELDAEIDKLEKMKESLKTLVALASAFAASVAQSGTTSSSALDTLIDTVTSKIREIQEAVKEIKADQEAILKTVSIDMVRKIPLQDLKTYGLDEPTLLQALDLAGKNDDKMEHELDEMLKSLNKAVEELKKFMETQSQYKAQNDPLPANAMQGNSNVSR